MPRTNTRVRHQTGPRLEPRSWSSVLERSIWGAALTLATTPLWRLFLSHQQSRSDPTRHTLGRLSGPSMKDSPGALRTGSRSRKHMGFRPARVAVSVSTWLWGKPRAPVCTCPDSLLSISDNQTTAVHGPTRWASPTERTRNRGSFSPRRSRYRDPHPTAHSRWPVGAGVWAVLRESPKHRSIIRWLRWGSWYLYFRDYERDTEAY